ncbi:MAG: hypothetical protein ACI910_002963 [Oleispira sp.]|jgi:hypothetical protein
MKNLLLIVLAATALGGCASMHAKNALISQVEFDHDCGKNQIKITSKSESIWAYRLTACGNKYKYRDFGNSKEFQFVDVTSGIPNHFDQ